MKQQIDWTKPVRMVTDPTLKVEVVADSETPMLDPGTGNRLLRWTGKGCREAGCYGIVSEYGNLIATLHSGAVKPSSRFSARQFVENVPEQPKDTLIMYKRMEDTSGSWRVMYDEPKTREHATAIAQSQGRACAFDTILVTVPEGTKFVHTIAQPATYERCGITIVDDVADPHALLKSSIAYLRVICENMRMPHKLGCEGVADMYERVCQAAEQTLAERQAAKDARPAMRRPHQ